MHLNLTFEIPPDAPSVEKSAGRLTALRAWGAVGVDSRWVGDDDQIIRSDDDQIMDSRWVGDEDQIMTSDVYNGI